MECETLLYTYNFYITVLNLSMESQVCQETISESEDHQSQIPLRMVFLGNVDSGKSTLLGVLAKGKLDDGRGLLRKFVFNHPHEISSGRTSSISTEFCQVNNRDVLFTDLCGHEKYLKTTLFGLNLVRPDWCVLVVGANMGVSKMTREHYGTAVSLGHKVLICITKTDICPKHVLTQTIQDVKEMCSRIRKRLIEIKELPNNPESPLLTADNLVAPMIRLSSVSGLNVNLLQNLISQLPRNTHYPTDVSVEFLIDHCYNVKGVGVVVAGTINKGKVTVGDTLYVNLPNRFTEVSVRSIYNERDQPVSSLTAGHHCTINIRSKKSQVKREDIHAGMVLVADSNIRLTRNFKAVVYIFHHQTTIFSKGTRRSGYQSIIHCNGIRQSAEIVKIAGDKQVLRSGEKSIVYFRFRYRPEYLVTGNKFIFREGLTRGVGKIIESYN